MFRAIEESGVRALLSLTKRFGARPRDADDIRWLQQLKARIS